MKLIESKCATIFISFIILFSIFIFLPENVKAADTDYYIANSGDDSNSGTSPDQAWKTISKLNNELSSGGCIVDGDDIFFKRGDIFDCTSPSLYNKNTDGTATNPMVIGAYDEGDDPILRDTASNGAIQNFVGDDIGYITFENLHFLITGDAGASEGMAADYDTFNIKIVNCIFENTAGGYIRTIFKNSHDLTFENCNWLNGSLQIYGDGSGDIPPTNTVVKNCDIKGGSYGPDCVVIHDNDHLDLSGNGPNHYFYNVVCHDTNSNAFDIVGARSGSYTCEWVYLKNCYAYDIYNSPCLVIGHGVANVTVEDSYFVSSFATPIYLTKSNNTIIRNCVFTAPTDVLAQGGPQYNYGWNLVNATLYHNTFITGVDGSGGEFITLNAKNVAPDHNCEGITFKNNIFYSTKNSAPNKFVYYIPTGPGTWNLDTTNSYYSHNMWWRGDGNLDDSRFILEDGSYNIETWNALDRVYNDLGNDPSLFNPLGNNFNNDFQLNSDSPCIDAGDWLTYTVGSGTGKTIKVKDANYFFPGISEFNIPGDNIFVGNDNNLKIISVDYNAETITVDKSITWTNGEYVSLSSYNGYAPDIGAFESIYYEPEPPSNSPEISNVLLIESNPLDTDEDYGWIKITADVASDAGISSVKLYITYPDDSNTNVVMTSAGSDTYYYNTSTIFSTYGDFSYYIWAKDINNNETTSSVYSFSMPPNWDIDKNGVCNILDLQLISNHYNQIGQNGWIREDVDNNGIIQVLDLIMISSYYGETW